MTMKSIKQKITTLAIWALVYSVNTSQTLAWRFGDDTSIAPWWATTSWFKQAFMNVLNYFLWFLSLLALAFIVYAGIKMVISQWEEEEFGKARTMIIYAITGLVVVILSYSLVRLVTDAPIA